MITHPAFGVTLPEWLPAPEGLDNPIIQTMLLRGRIDNTTPPEIAALRAVCERLEPREVHLLTVNKLTGCGGLDPVPDVGLLQVQASFSEVMPCRACV